MNNKKLNMHRALILHLMNLALAAMATAQNLVSNPSFEDTTHCNLYQPPFEEAVGWYSANFATPDIWDCDTIAPCGRFMDVTDSGIQIKGYKTAFHGSRFAGGFHWYGPGGNAGTREYLTTRLQTDLLPGQAYRVSMYCARPKGHRRAIDHIGVYFGPDSINEQLTTALQVSPQVELRDPMNPYLVDTSWVQLVDTFMASGGERWMVFGTFHNDDEVIGIDLPPLWPSDNAYYYVDVVSVTPLIAEAITEQPGGYLHLIATSEEVSWSSSRPLETLLLFDAVGRVVWQPDVLPTATGSIDVPGSLAQGHYTVVAMIDGQRDVVRFIK